MKVILKSVDQSVTEIILPAMTAVLVTINAALVAHVPFTSAILS